MPAYSFSKSEFVPMILDGRKPHTIRPRRKHPTKTGDLLTLYYKQRTRECQAICITVCKQVIPVVIYPYDLEVVLTNRRLNLSEVTNLARRDGFDNRQDFFRFFQRYGEHILNNFVIVEWNPKKLIKLWDDHPFITPKTLTKEQWQRQWNYRFGDRR